MQTVPAGMPGSIHPVQIQPVAAAVALGRGAGWAAFAVVVMAIAVQDIRPTSPRRIAMLRFIRYSSSRERLSRFNQAFWLLRSMELSRLKQSTKDCRPPTTRH